MNEKDMIQLKKSITMPVEMADTLLQNCSQAHRKHYHYSRYSKICAALAALTFITALSSTSYAAYNVYQEKQLAVFMDSNLTPEEKAALGDQLAQIPGIASYAYISGDEAWEEFQAHFLSGDAELEALAAAFPENPLKDSYNYRISVRLGADTQAIREEISHLDGVRHITTVRELKTSESANAWGTEE